MTPKVRRGLGLLVLVPLLLGADALLFWSSDWMNNPGGPPDWLAIVPIVLGFLAAVGALIALVAGLTLLAVGLLRSDPA